ncbi:MAG: MBL fold metallo-hydrolase [Actinobacteria bacterium]|nr:MBL fold metallo-hydrolase [Actinomycetota bacterium]
MDAQRTTSSLSLTFVGHATVLLEMDGVRLLTDPLLRRRIGVLLRRSPIPGPGLRRDLDAVLISHAHLDHLDVPSLRLIDRATPVVVPRGLGRLLRRIGFEPLEMDVGDVVAIGPAGEGSAPAGPVPGGVRITAVPADHPGTRYPLVGAAPALGYVIERAMTVYFAGDTGLYPEMGDIGPVDVAVLPVGGWGPRLPDDHLNPLSAAKALRLLRPAACVPVHWGTIYPPWLPPEFNARWSRWPHVFARYAAHLAPEVEVRVLQPGETTVFRPAEVGEEAGGA